MSKLKENINNALDNTNIPVPPVTSSVNKLNAPQQCGVITGKVIAIGNAFEQNGKQRVAITINAGSAKAAKAMEFGGISKAQHDNVIVFVSDSIAGKAKVGGKATISIEQRIEGVTGYKDKEGWKLHTTTHFAISGLPTFEEHTMVSETKAVNQGKFDWLQEIGVSREEAVDVIKSRITF